MLHMLLKIVELVVLISGVLNFCDSREVCNSSIDVMANDNIINNKNVKILKKNIVCL